MSKQEYTVETAIKNALSEAERKDKEDLLLNTFEKDVFKKISKFEAEGKDFETVYTLISLYADDENNDGTWDSKIEKALEEKYPHHFYIKPKGETIGKILSSGKIEKEWSGSGNIYKNFSAFENKTDEICYVPEHDEECDGYTYNDFLELAKEKFIEYGVEGNPEKFAQAIFENCDWQHPETLLIEMDMVDEFENYPETYGIKK